MTKLAFIIAVAATCMLAGGTIAHAQSLIPYADPTGTVYFSDNGDHGDSFGTRWSGAGLSSGDGVGFLEYSNAFSVSGNALHVGAGGSWSRGASSQSTAFTPIGTMPVDGYVVSEDFYIPTPAELSPGVSDSDFADFDNLLVTGPQGGTVIQDTYASDPAPPLTATTAYLRTYLNGRHYNPVSRGRWHQMTLYHSSQGIELFMDGHILHGWENGDSGTSPTNLVTGIRFGNSGGGAGGEIYADNIIVASASVPQRNVLESHDFSSASQASAFTGYHYHNSAIETVTDPVSVTGGQMHVNTNDLIVTSRQFNLLASSDERVEMKFTIAGWDGKQTGDAVGLKLVVFNPDLADSDSNTNVTLGRFWSLSATPNGDGSGKWQNGIYREEDLAYGGVGSITGGPIKVGDTIEVLTGRGIGDNHRLSALTILVNGQVTTTFSSSGDFTPLEQLGFASMNGAILDNFSIHAYQTVPEPDSLALVGVGGLLLLRRRRRRNVEC